ncbi:MAG TPA: phosphatase PAP2 family protein, partial [Arachidicoccus sp.]
VINTAVISGIGSILLKSIFDRPRPNGIHLVTESSSSFPSGHAMASILCYGTIWLFVPLFIKNKKIRLCIQFLLGLLIISIGISRIYLGVHYPSDIIAGYAVALGWLLGTYPIYVEKSVKYRFQNRNFK